MMSLYVEHWKSTHEVSWLEEFPREWLMPPIKWQIQDAASWNDLLGNYFHAVLLELNISPIVNGDIIWFNDNHR